MTTLAKANLITREAVGKLENRFGRKGLYLGGAFLLLVLFLVFRSLGTKTGPPTGPPPRPVATAKVITRDVPLYLDEIGTTVAFETVQVQAQVSGQIISREFKDGADVKKGDLLFRIDSRAYEATLAAAKADLVLAEANLKRNVLLEAKDVMATQDLDTAKANAMRTAAAVASAQVNVDYCSIRSPIDGRVGLRNVDVGNVVSPGNGTSLVMIQGMDPIYTDFSISEPDLPLVRRHLGGPNVKVLTDAEDDGTEPREGNLYFIDSAVQPGAGTVKARAITPNRDRVLWPSQFVRVRLVLDVLKDAKLVPSSAVQMGQRGPYVFVVKPDSTLDLRQVKPGQPQGDLTVITDGVKAGEVVVVSGQLQLAPGAKVVVKEIRDDEASGDPSAKALK